MNKRVKTKRNAGKTGKAKSKPAALREDPKLVPRKPAFFIDAQGIRHPIYVGIDLGREPGCVIEGEQTGYGDYPRPAATSPIKCEQCRHGEAHGCKRVCRSFLSPRAGFAHDLQFACGYGRAADQVQVQA